VSLNNGSAFSLPGLKGKTGEAVSLVFSRPPNGRRDYPTWPIQKGLIIARGNTDFVEEGLGFGVPLLKFGNTDIFPGKTSLSSSRAGDSITVEVVYDLNLIKKLNRKGRRIENSAIYRIYAFLGKVHRDYPWLRGAGNWFFGRLKNSLGMKSTFKRVPSAGTVKVHFKIPAGKNKIYISADFSHLRRTGLTEIIMANEQGASYFDAYRDTGGDFLSGNRIGTWDEVTAARASLVSEGAGIVFTAGRINNARLFRGREFEVGRLAWSGLNYVIPPSLLKFSYDIEVQETA
jgi:hypothetical protein